MTAKFFLDTNIALYTIGQDKQKIEVARGLVAKGPFVSAQVINECVNVCLRKFGFSRVQAYAFADNMMRRTNVLPVDEAVIRKSAAIAIQNQISNWDALIVAAALLAECDTLYSEDMQHGQIFEGRLTIVNPFYSK
jgi:predicted nucleic acid-binding protein